ncbi:CatB-related O-acetyltransferase [Vibrio diazotrophicus]|uniref:CatB-related O-acetyltransferase n=1 Tax=Vibrio diazotrophicus TaxID=685 RepID=UPI000C9DCCE0|nr:CatB-related O-acetyltransferase [Vibrio diazotrophicus]PNH94607.1 hypothetical protein C1M59_00785 [Vibrio diazotrophicus]
MKRFIINKYLSYRYNIKISRHCRISRNSKFGVDCKIESGCIISNSNLGNYVYVGNDSRMFKAHIGSYSSVGPRVIIGENEHILNHYSTSNFLLNNEMKEKYKEINNAETEIGNDVWIGAGAIIKKGVKIGDGAVIGAGAIVTKDINMYEIAVGIPAKIISTRLDYETQTLLRESEWWNLNPEEAVQIFCKLAQERRIETS